jgi:hypothetical protein
MTYRFSLTMLWVITLGFAAWPGEALAPAPEGTFALAVIPDTQLYLGPGSGRGDEGGEPRNPAFETRTTWLAQNLESQRVVFISHMGDIVDRNEPRQWRIARENMDRFHGRIPYGLSVGNHDMVCDTGEAALFQEHFGAERFAGEPWYGESYDGDMAGIHGNNVNSYQRFTAGGLDFLTVHLECNAPDVVLAWADRVIESHRDRMVIITTHMYLGGIARKGALEPQGRMTWKKCHGERGNTPQQLWEKSFSKHPNLFLVLCGDQSASITHHQTSEGSHGNQVHEILTDYPRDADESDWLRLLRFDPARQIIEVWTYSPAQDRLCEGVGHRMAPSDHQFTLDIAGALADYRARLRQ